MSENSSTTLEKLLNQGAELLDRYEKSQLLLEKKSDDYSEKLKIELDYSIKLIKEEIKILDPDESVNDLRIAGLEAEKRIEDATKNFEIEIDKSKKQVEELLALVKGRLDTSQIMKDFNAEITKVVALAKEDMASTKDEHASTLEELIAKVFQLEKKLIEKDK